MHRLLDTLGLRWSTSRPHGRLGDFCLVGRAGPVAACLLTGAGLYWVTGAPSALVFAKLWLAYSVAYVGLAVLARHEGTDAPWVLIVPVAAIGIAIGGLASASVALAPDWHALTVPAKLWPECAIGAAFSAFFVGLSLASAREQQVADTRRQLLEARLQALTAQIEPHFLMNTLANLRYLVTADAKAAVGMLEHLADFLEGALQRSRSSQSTLGQELRLVESYLSIMQIRMGRRLRFTIDIGDELKPIGFPPLLLQTLVENAVTHGIQPLDGEGTIAIAVRREREEVLITVRDDGVGLGAASARGEGVGLTNTRERLATFFGGGAALKLAPGTPCGTVAAITIPARAVAGV